MKKAIKQALATIAAIPVLVLFAIVLIYDDLAEAVKQFCKIRKEESQ